MTKVKREQEGYDPRKKLGFFYKHITSQLSKIWWPSQYLSVNEGCIPFKGRIHFWCYNPSKIDKYHMKTFKLVDSTNNHYLKFELYVAIDKPSTSEFEKTHDLVVRLLQEYIGKSYIIFMDNFFTHLHIYLFYELKKI